MQRELVWLFALALALRLAALLVTGSAAEAQGVTPWEWGGEAPTLAAALYEGRGFADPWGAATGPTAWLTPVYPALVALAMGVGGGVTPVTATLVFGLQSVVSAATCVLLALLGARLGLAAAGRLAGWLFALYPLAVQNAIAVVWDTTLVAFGVTAFLLVLLVRGRTGPGLAGSGLVYGALLLLNPAPITFLPALLAWIVLGPPRGDWTTALRHALIFVASAMVVCLPWSFRNRRVLGTWQLRPNFGVEMRIGNHDGADGRPVPFEHHPSHVARERALYVELGEAAYGSENMGRALDWIAANPGRFAALTARRMMLFWVGELPTRDPRRSAELAPEDDLASWVKFAFFFASGVGALAALLLVPLLRERKILLAGALLLFGTPYFLSHVSERYRFPIDPLIVLLDAWLLLLLLRRGAPLYSGGGFEEKGTQETPRT